MGVLAAGLLVSTGVASAQEDTGTDLEVHLTTRFPEWPRAWAGAVAEWTIFTVEMTSSGPAAIAEFDLLIELPEGVGFVTADSAFDTSCSPGATPLEIRCVLSGHDLWIDGARITLSNDGVPAGSTVTTVVSIHSSAPDPDPSNNAVRVPITFAGGPIAPPTTGADLLVRTLPPETYDLPVHPTFLFLVANRGPEHASALTVTMTVPEGVTFVSAGAYGRPPDSCAIRSHRSHSRV